MTLFALILASVLVERAPLSVGQLAAAADRVDLPHHDLRRERTHGSARCRPCPTLERHYRGPDLIAEAALIEVAAALVAAGYPIEITTEARRTGRITTSTPDVAVAAKVVRLDAGGTRLTLTFRSRR